MPSAVAADLIFAVFTLQYGYAYILAEFLQDIKCPLSVSYEFLQVVLDTDLLQSS